MSQKQTALIKIIKQSGYKQGEIAEHLGITKWTMSQKMNMRKDFTWSEVCTICKILNVENPLFVILPTKTK